MYFLASSLLAAAYVKKTVAYFYCVVLNIYWLGIEEDLVVYIVLLLNQVINC